MTVSTARKSEFPEAGDVFAQRYRIVSLIGRGGFSRVYSARVGRLDRPVAVKVLVPRGAGSSSSREIVEKRFYREARLLSRLSGPNTITVFDYGRASGGLLFMVSELIEGQNLKQLLESEGSLSEARARRIFSQLLLGLREVHAHGFLHRDVKPSNVMVFDEVGERDRAKLLDFGIAKGVTVGATDDTALTMAGFVIGTPGYMSPEQALGRPVTRASDLFSAGLVAYEMLTGQSPFRGLSLEQLQRRLMAEPLRLPGTLDISDDFRHVVERVLTIDADDRYETAAGALSDLGVADADYEERGDAQHTPRPSNLLTFPMQLDSSGSTIVDTLTDGATGETRTILLPDADTFEERLPGYSEGERENLAPRPSADRERSDADEGPQAEARPTRGRAEQIPDPGAPTLPGERAPTKQSPAIWLVIAIVAGAIIVAAIVFGSGGDETSQPPEEREDGHGDRATAERIEDSIDPSATIVSAHDLVWRSIRNAELDAEIRVKEDRLIEEEPMMEFEPDPVPEEPPSRPIQKRPPEPDVAADEVPAEETTEAEPQDEAADRESEPTPDERPPPKRDFEVKPIDEL